MASEQLRPKGARFRARWRAHQHRLDPRRLIFIDETWIKTNMTRTQGWAARGRRLTAHVPHGHWKTLTFLVGLRHDRIIAPFVLDGAINGEMFTAWVGQCLAPTLAPGRHRDRRQPRQPQRCSRSPIDPPGGRPSSVPAALQPRPQPHRNGFRQAQDPVPKGRRANHRSLMAIGTFLDTFTPTECQNYLRHAGYASV